MGAGCWVMGWVVGNFVTHINWNRIRDRSNALVASERSISESILQALEWVPILRVWRGFYKWTVRRRFFFSLFSFWVFMTDSQDVCDNQAGLERVVSKSHVSSGTEAVNEDGSIRIPIRFRLAGFGGVVSVSLPGQRIYCYKFQRVTQGSQGGVKPPLSAQSSVVDNPCRVPVANPYHASIISTGVSKLDLPSALPAPVEKKK